jgi:NAD(P)-dependent dehydrogenase (short-subunit alcohol dehydrogenase family)
MSGGDMKSRLAEQPPRRRIAAVTGGTRGIGLGIVKALIAEGWSLALSGRRSPEEIEPLLLELRASGGEAAYFQGDLGSREGREGFINGIRQTFGALHLLVNNAGMAPRERRDLLEASEESFDELIGVNLKGPYFLTQAAAKLMLESRRTETDWKGGITFVTSVSAETASLNRGEYCVSKAGLAMTARLFAVRLGSEGIPVWEIRPGLIQTDMTAGVKSRYDTLIAEGLVPEGRWGFPEDIGKTVAALARGDIPYATGSVIHLDGGLHLPRL